MTPLPKLLLLANLCCALTAQPASPERIVWDNAAADDWQVAYPVGNGKLGALPFASFPQEKILINEETIWARNSPKQMPENYFQVLETIREFEQAGQYAEADRHFEESLEAIITPNSYQLLGWLDLEYLDTAPHKSTYRELDLRTGIAKSVYSLDDGSTITQEVFAVGADDVIVIHITADKAFALSVSMEGATIENGDLVKSAAGTGKDATRYVSRVRSLADNNAETDGDALKLENTKSVILYLSAATDYNRIQAGQNLADGWQPKAKQDLDAVTSKPFKTVRETAIAENQHYFDRMDVDFGTTDPSILALPTKERLQRIKDGKHDDPDLIATYFQLGRYLLIASSRPGSLPANLQGIWNPLEKARWSSDFHLNINLQMNYWLAETTNLSELHQPLFDLIRYLQAPGKEMAQRLGMEGWCMGHATDVWGHSRIMWRKAHWSGSFFNGQWLTFHILENYRFNRDATVLEENWDILTDSTRFVESWLIRDADSGKWVARPGCSPENSFTYLDQAGNTRKAALSSGTTFDQFMILQVFNEYVEAAAVLGKTNDLYVQKIKALIPEIYMPQIGDDGRLMEWRLPFGEKEPGHRHISHVLGAFPGNQINLDNDPRMRSAVEKSIEGRLANGGAKTGWSRAWTIGMFARLSDADRAYENLHAILVRSTIDNLWNSHPPFQIDGNLGATAAIAEMLLHSHNNEIKLLPALPEQWPDGHIRGLRARGDYTIDIRWEDGALTETVIHAGKRSTGSIDVVYKDQRTRLELEPGEKRTLTGVDL